MSKNDAGGPFVSSAKKEWRKIVWPDIKEVKVITAAAVIVTALTAAATAAIDTGMMLAISRLIGH